MSTLRGNFGDLLAPGIRKIIFGKYAEKPEEFSKIFNVGTSKRQYEQDTQVSGFGHVPIKPEGVATAYDDPAQGYKTTYTHVSYGLGFRISREMYDDDLYGVMSKMAKELARSARATIESDAANIFNRAFSTSYAHATEGRPLVATAHPLLKSSGTYDNTLSTPASLGVTSLRDAILVIENMVNERNLPANLSGKILLVSPTNKFIARELLGSEWKPGSAQNEINSLLDEDLGYMVSHYFTDSGAWFLLTDKSDHELNFIWRQKMSFAHDNDFDTDDAKFKIFYRYSLGWSDWRGVTGSNGTY